MSGSICALVLARTFGGDVLWHGLRGYSIATGVLAWCCWFCS
jgi:hypothetical protein